MNYNYLPLVARDIIFKKIVSSLNVYDFFDVLLRLRFVNKEFKKFIDIEFKKYFTLKKISPYGDLENFLDAKSVFLRDRLINTMEQETYMVTEFEKDSKGRILCGICNDILHSSCYMSKKSDRLNDHYYSVYNFFMSEITCWGCYSNIYGIFPEDHIKYEDILHVCHKVNDFVDKFV